MASPTPTPNSLCIQFHFSVERQTSKWKSSPSASFFILHWMNTMLPSGLSVHWKDLQALPPLLKALLLTFKIALIRWTSDQMSGRNGKLMMKHWGGSSETSAPDLGTSFKRWPVPGWASTDPGLLPCSAQQTTGGCTGGEGTLGSPHPAPCVVVSLDRQLSNTKPFAHSLLIPQVGWGREMEKKVKKSWVEIKTA